MQNGITTETSRLILRRFRDDDWEDLRVAGNPIWNDTYMYGILADEWTKENRG